MSNASLLQGILPAPKRQYNIQQEEEDDLVTSSASNQNNRKLVPAYGSRKNFVPLGAADFGDGGAFPEIHVVQYPLNMGKPGQKSTAVVAVDVDSNGQVRYDSIVKYGANRNKLVQSTLAEMKEKEGDKDVLALPEEKEELDTAEKTRVALEALLDGKIKGAKPASAVHTNQPQSEPTYIRYAADPSAPGYKPETKQRVIRMVEAQVDPMEPPKHKLKKAPGGPPSPPVPILHSPPRKVTVEDRQTWKIPPCISNWKNARGYTIPLDKRLAADGRGLQEVTINNKFAMISEALYVAERKAAEDLRVRNQIRKKMAVKEKEDREQELRDMALRARMERAGALGGGGGDDDEISSGRPDAGVGAGGGRRESIDSPRSDHSDDDRGRGARGRGGGHGRSHSRSHSRSGSRDRGGGDRSRRDSHDSRGRGGGGRGGGGGGGRGRGDGGSDDDNEERAKYGESEDDRVARLQREKLRVERRKERERELRLENMKGNMRKNKIDRDEGRDVSERIALGMLKGSGNATGEAMYDSRLFNQSAGMDSGFGAEDDYNTYSKPLFERTEASSIYRPKKDDSDIYGDVDTQMAKLSDTSKFKPDKGFKGAEGGGSGAPRDAPVQFERMREEDPFGIDDIVGKSSKKARHD